VSRNYQRIIFQLYIVSTTLIEWPPLLFHSEFISPETNFRVILQLRAF